MLAGAHVPAAVHHVPLASEHRTEHGHVIVRVVLEVGVLDDQELAGGALDPCANGAPLSPVLRHAPQQDIRLRFHDCRRLVSRTVIDHDDLFRDAQRREIHGLDLFQERADETLFVVGGNHDRQHAGCHGSHLSTASPVVR